MQDSAVSFATNSRIHLALAAKDLERSVAFYRTLFGQGPTKTRPRYAKFEVAEPPVNLALNETGGPTGPNNAVAHFGIQVQSTAAVQAAAKRLAESGLETALEDNVTCCYAVQNKVWATDPDGNQWEVYVVLDNDGAQHLSNRSTCCSEYQGECCSEYQGVGQMPACCDSQWVIP
ncbi:MAG: VOC family protein [Gemmataceae bacterium]|nr:VOC family protein [Gemmataceae bacterium]